MSDYSNQLAEARNNGRQKSEKRRRRATKNLGKKGNIDKRSVIPIQRLAAKLAARMHEAAQNKESWVWPFLFFLAITNDLADLAIIGSVPIVGDFADLTLTIFFFFVGGFIKWKIRLAALVAGFLEMIPFVSVFIEWLPFWVLCALYARHRVNEEFKEAEAKYNKLTKKNKIKI